MLSLQYKGFIGSVAFCREDNLFYGKIEHTVDLITYEADTLESLYPSFTESVEDYQATLAAMIGFREEVLNDIDALAWRVLANFEAELVKVEVLRSIWSGPKVEIVKWFRVSGADVADMSWTLAKAKAQVDTDALRSGSYHVGFRVAAT